MVRIVLDLLLVYFGARFFTFLLAGGRAAAFIRSALLSATVLRSYVVPVLILGAVRVYYRASNRGVPFLVRIRSPLFLFFVVLAIYVLPPISRGFSDSTASRFLPISLLREGDFDLDEFSFLYRRSLFRCWSAARCWTSCRCETEEVGLCPPGDRECLALDGLEGTFTSRAYFIRRAGDHVVSAYPPWPAVLALPVYALPVLGGRVPAWSPLIASFERLAAAIITALSVLILYAAVRKITTEPIAWLVAVIYALGTSSFSVSSQSLWQHGSTQLFLAASIYLLLLGREKPFALGLSGFALAGLVLCRPVNVLVALPLVAYVLRESPRRLIALGLWALPLVIAFLAYNQEYFGSMTRTGFTGLVVGPDLFRRETALMFGTPLFDGLAGLLVSPGRGLFVYSPILLASFAGMIMIWRRPGERFLKYASIAPMVLILLSAKWIYWWGGWSYGPRILADVLPLLCLYLCAPFEASRERPLLKWTLVVLAVASIGLHTLGAFGSGTWESSAGLEENPERALWSWAGSPPVFYAREIATEIGRRF